MKKLIVTIILISLVMAAAGCGKNATQGSLGNSNDVNFGSEEEQKIIIANNQLGMKLLSGLKDDGDNVFISPTSLFYALSMVYNGADGETKAELAKTLQVEGIETSVLNEANASFMKMLHSKNDIQLNMANSIWLNDRYHFQSDFAQNNQDYYNAEIQEMNVMDESSPKRINEWVKKATNNKITEIVKSPLDPRLVAILINAIYFKGDWTYEFDEKATEKRIFYVDGEAKKEIPLMMLHEKLSYIENDSFQAVSLPYGEDESMSMKVFLPKENASLTEFEKSINMEKWQRWMGEFQEKQGTIMLPKFKLEYEILLNESLQKLGLTSAFEEDADFSKMIAEDDPVWISKVKQKTYLDVNEKGTEAAAVTSVEMETTSAPAEEPFYMEVNRPFFIAITDDETGGILFIGHITNPQTGK